MACPTCRAKNETIRALKDTISAKDQAILVMADQIDAFRGVQTPQSPTFPQFAPERTDGKMWIDDEEEELVALFEQGHISMDVLEEKMAALQATNQTLTVVQ